MLGESISAPRIQRRDAAGKEVRAEPHVERSVGVAAPQHREDRGVGQVARKSRHRLGETGILGETAPPDDRDDGALG